jgi:hypothetical protein
MLLVTLEVTLFPVAETISPCFAVPEASTTSLVVPPDGGLKGAGPDEAPARSHGFGGGLLPDNHIHRQHSAKLTMTNKDGATHTLNRNEKQSP